MAATEINPEYGRAQSKWMATAREWLAVILATVGFLMGLSSIFLSIHTSVRAGYQDREIEEQSQSLKVYRIRAAKLDAYLKAKGIPIEEVYNDVPR